MDLTKEPLALPNDVYLRAIRHHGDQLADAAASVGLDSDVPTCPDWTMRDLVQHTEAVFRHKTEIVERAGEPEPPPWPGADDTVDVEAYRATLDRMLAVFDEADLDQPCWTWSPHDRRADWWVRRMAHEAAIHAADAVVAAGGTPAIDEALAVDGIDELLDEMLVGGPDWGTVTPGEGRIDLRSPEKAWQLRFGSFVGTSPTTGRSYDIPTLVYDASGEPDAVVSSDAASLDLWLWGRAALPEGSTEGDASLVDALRSLAAEGTQ